MTSSINSLVAGERVADLQRAAAQRRRLELVRDGAVAEPRPVAMRLAVPADQPAIRRLADLDDAPELDGPTLVALVGGEPVAALSLRDERHVANPFVRSADAVELLRLRARQLRPRGARRRSTRLHLLRRAA